MAGVSFLPTLKSLTLDNSEQYVYFGSNSNPLDVVRLSATTGSIVDAQRL